MTETLELPDRLSRREFLRLSGASLLALGAPVHWARPKLEIEPGLFGRVTDPTVVVYREPSFAGTTVKTLWRDDVVPLAGALIGDRVPEHNRVWYEISGLGYAHSSALQPVRDEPNPPLESVSPNGNLMEVTVPYVDAHWRPREDSEKVYRFYYASTFWVVGISRDVKLQKWYLMFDDKYDYHYFARAEAFRPIPAAELIPVAPYVPHEEKRIQVDLTNQWVHCYEGSQQIYSTRVSTGRKFDEAAYYTPAGDFVTFRKRPSRHMSAGNLASGYDLPGVPWVVYITEDGVSFHGTYWHNDYGAPRSHGCINMTPEAARWLFRWSYPVVPRDEMEIWVDYGTSVRVHT